MDSCIRRDNTEDARFRGNDVFGFYSLIEHTYIQDTEIPKNNGPRQDASVRTRLGKNELRLPTDHTNNRAAARRSHPGTGAPV